MKRKLHDTHFGIKRFSVCVCGQYTATYTHAHAAYSGRIYIYMRYITSWPRSTHNTHTQKINKKEKQNRKHLTLPKHTKTKQINFFIRHRCVLGHPSRPRPNNWRHFLGSFVRRATDRHKRSLSQPAAQRFSRKMN